MIILSEYHRIIIITPGAAHVISEFQKLRELLFPLFLIVQFPTGTLFQIIWKDWSLKSFQKCNKTAFGKMLFRYKDNLCNSGPISTEFFWLLLVTGKFPVAFWRWQDNWLVASWWLVEFCESGSMFFPFFYVFYLCFFLSSFQMQLFSKDPIRNKLFIRLSWAILVFTTCLL